MKKEIGLMVAIAIGDSYGAVFEFKPLDFIAENNDLKYLNGLGYYTDDSQQSISLAEHMLSGYPCTHEYYMEFFVNQYQMDRRNGYSRRMKSLLSHVSDKTDHFEHVREVIAMASELPTRNSNGSVMRSLPLGLYPTPEQVKKACVIQSSVTHPTMECILGSQVVALMAHYYYYDIGREGRISMNQFMVDNIGTELYDMMRYRYVGGELACDALDTASFVYQVMNQSHSNHTMASVLKFVVSVGGDVDSSAALCLGLASLSGMTNDLPDELFYKLENNDFGLDYLFDLDSRLLRMFPRSTIAL